MLRLVRIDGDGPTPPPDSGLVLTSGTHPFGRGVFLGCEDKRVSRRHGKLDVADSSVMLTALHQNPCFVIKKGSKDTLILKRGEANTLTVGDKFGLLPSAYWYELGLKNENDQLINTEFDEVVREEATVTAHGNGHTLLTNGTAVPSDDDEEMISFPEEPENADIVAPNSPSLLVSDQNGIGPGSTETNSLAAKRAHSIDGASDTSPAKVSRANTSPSPADATLPAPGIPSVSVPNEPEDIKPSTSDLHAAMAEVVGRLASAIKQEIKKEPDSRLSPPRAAAAPAPVPVSAVPLGRERCIYGAQCYRRNPQHKAAFSHPSDADWGSGAQGVCPWGAGCTRRDPRHWQHHMHPQGTLQPSPSTSRDAGDAKRPRQKKKRRVSPAGSDADTPDVDPANILPAKRQRRQLKRPSWSGSESDNEYDMDDPFMTDGSEEEWVPDKEDTPSDYTQSQ